MTAILYFSRNPNPRLAVAVARHLQAPVTMEWSSPFDPAQAEFFRNLNPTQRIPIMVEAGQPLWEADAIACRLSQQTGSDFWREGADLPEMVQWISWGKENFVRACDMVHFERGTKQRYGIGPADPDTIAQGLELFDEAARVLDAHLKGRVWVLGDRVSYADFRMATFLPFNDIARLPVDSHPSVADWARRLGELPFWDDPFVGLNAPALPPMP